MTRTLAQITLAVATVSIGLSTLPACDPGEPCDAIRDLATSPEGLELTEVEHPGWGRTECFQCHNVFRIHQHECLSVDGVDVVAINDLIDPADTTTCLSCHGENGSTAWPEVTQ